MSDDKMLNRGDQRGRKISYYGSVISEKKKISKLWFAFCDVEFRLDCHDHFDAPEQAPSRGSFQSEEKLQR